MMDGIVPATDWVERWARMQAFDNRHCRLNRHGGVGAEMLAIHRVQRNVAPQAVHRMVRCPRPLEETRMKRWMHWLIATLVAAATAGGAAQAQEDRRDRGANRGEGQHGGEDQRWGGRERGDQRNGQDGRYDANRYGRDDQRYEANRYDQSGRRDDRRWDGDRGRDGRRWDGDRNRWDGRGDRRHWDGDRWDRHDVQRHGRHDGWNRDHWRRSWRHGWNGHRWRAPVRYVYPRGYGRRAWNVGLILPSVFYGSIYYVDWQPYGLAPPPYGSRWIRIDGDLLLVHLATGEVLDVLRDFFY